MTPSIDLRIETIVRAMEDVVTPAIDQENSLAREQVALIIGHLRLIGVQWSRAEGYAQTCLADLTDCVRPLRAQGGPATEAAGRELQASLDTVGRAEAHYKQVMSAADALVRASYTDGDPKFRSELQACLLDFSLRQSLRDRSWFAGTGFDLHPDQLIPIDDLVAETAS